MLRLCMQLLWNGRRLMVLWKGSSYLQDHLTTGVSAPDKAMPYRQAASLARCAAPSAAEVLKTLGGEAIRTPIPAWQCWDKSKETRLLSLSVYRTRRRTSASTRSWAPSAKRGALPAWRLRFPDGGTIRLRRGEHRAVTARRSDLWRIYDTLWALHLWTTKNPRTFIQPVVSIAPPSKGRITPVA